MGVKGGGWGGLEHPGVGGLSRGMAVKGEEEDPHLDVRQLLGLSDGKES